MKEYKFKNNIQFEFWHEKNSLYFVDKIETLPDTKNNECNLDLTYAVRDGIVCHCGEVNQNAIFPRHEAINLDDINEPGKIQPYTWEGCIVKIADKISYLGRDIEDAIKLNILSLSQYKELTKIFYKVLRKGNDDTVNNTVLMHDFMSDLCSNSSIDKGIYLSEKYLELMKKVCDFNYKNIYGCERLENFKVYAKLILETIITTLEKIYSGSETLDKLDAFKDNYPILCKSFSEWLIKYTKNYEENGKAKRFTNVKIYDLEIEKDYYQAIVDYISGMTDSFAMRVFNEIMQL